MHRAVPAAGGLNRCRSIVHSYLWLQPNNYFIKQIDHLSSGIPSLLCAVWTGLSFKSRWRWRSIAPSKWPMAAVETSVQNLFLTDEKYLTSNKVIGCGWMELRGLPYNTGHIVPRSHQKSKYGCHLLYLSSTPIILTPVSRFSLNSLE